MKIVIDDKIPYIREAVAGITEDAVYLPGSTITAADVADADALIVRTRTKCDKALLAGSRVKFVGTATIGYDHIDIDYLDRSGIAWTNCPGCNAGSVAQYVRASLLLIERDFALRLKEATIGIVGCGHVGSLVKGVCERLGMRVLVCDPPREETESRLSGDELDRYLNAGGRARVERYSSLEEIEREADVITFHVPLEMSSSHPTFHIADSYFFRRLKKAPFIINSSRGAVVCNDALLEALNSRMVRQGVIDTWEYEPDINPGLLRKVYIGTPHIAGYSADGKTNADNMVLAALCRHFGLPVPEPIMPPPLPEEILVGNRRLSGSPVGRSDNGGSQSESCGSRIGYAYGGSENLEIIGFYDDPTASLRTSALRELAVYNPLVDSRRLKAAPEDFERLRGDYPLRREL